MVEKRKRTEKLLNQEYAEGHFYTRELQGRDSIQLTVQLFSITMRFVTFPVTPVHNEGGETSLMLLGLLLMAFFLLMPIYVTYLCTKISKSLFGINRIKNFVNSAAQKMLYFATVHAHITYCLTVYNCINTTTACVIYMFEI
jgi:hypothetical protein